MVTRMFLMVSGRVLAVVENQLWTCGALQTRIVVDGVLVLCALQLATRKRASQRMPIRGGDTVFNDLRCNQSR